MTKSRNLNRLRDVESGTEPGDPERHVPGGQADQGGPPVLSQITFVRETLTEQLGRNRRDRRPELLGTRLRYSYVQFVSTTLAGVRMDLPKYESVHLQRSPLVLVAAQINFEEVARDVSHRQARDVQRAISTDFWRKLQAAPQVRTTLTPAGAVSEPNRQAYRLLSADEAWSLVINPDSVILETREYLGWADMAVKVTAIAEAVSEVLDPAQQLRLGLRYVDQVPMPDGHESWQGLIPDTLLGIRIDRTFGDAVLGSDERHLLQVDNDVRCMLRHGLLADTEQRPGRLYLLDYDVYNETQRPFAAQDVTAVAETLHEYAGSLFLASVEKDLYDWLKG